MTKYHAFKKHVRILKHAFIQAQYNGWKPVEAPWLPDGVTWDVVDVVEGLEGTALYVHCTAHRQFHTITSSYQPEERYVRYFLLQPGCAKALGYPRADLQAWCDNGNDPVEYLSQFVDHPV
jgi:hypothetical protein